MRQVFQNNDISVKIIFAIQPLAVVQHQALHQLGIVTAEYLPNRTEMIIQQLQGRPRPVSYCQLLEVSGTWRHRGMLAAGHLNNFVTFETNSRRGTWSSDCAAAAESRKWGPGTIELETNIRED